MCFVTFSFIYIGLMNVVYYIQGIITLILATDMARHSEIMDNFNEKRETFDFHDEDDLTAVIFWLTLALALLNLPHFPTLLF